MKIERAKIFHRECFTTTLLSEETRKGIIQNWKLCYELTQLIHVLFQKVYNWNNPWMLKENYDATLQGDLKNHSKEVREKQCTNKLLLKKQCEVHLGWYSSLSFKRCPEDTTYDGELTVHPWFEIFPLHPNLNPKSCCLYYRMANSSRRWWWFRLANQNMERVKHIASLTHICPPPPTALNLKKKTSRRSNNGL